jgi:hypothetical protein
MMGSINTGIVTTATEDVENSMTQAVSHGLLTTEAWVHAEVTPCGICSRQSGTGTGYFPNYSIFPVNIIPLWFSILISHAGDEQTA